jgi:hypothetical protein
MPVMSSELIKVQLNGRTYYGTCRYLMPTVYVTSPLGSKAKQRGSGMIKEIAEQTLREIVYEAEGGQSVAA